MQNEITLYCTWTSNNKDHLSVNGTRSIEQILVKDDLEVGTLRSDPGLLTSRGMWSEEFHLLYFFMWQQIKAVFGRNQGYWLDSCKRWLSSEWRVPGLPQIHCCTLDPRHLPHNCSRGNISQLSLHFDPGCDIQRQEFHTFVLVHVTTKSVFAVCERHMDGFVPGDFLPFCRFDE